MKKKIISIFLILSVVSLCFGQNHSKAQVLSFVQNYENLANRLSSMVGNVERMVNSGNINSARNIMRQCRNLQSQLNTLQSRYPFYANEIVNNDNYVNRILNATEKISVTLARLENVAWKLE